MHVGRSHCNGLYRHLVILWRIIGLSLCPLLAQTGVDSSVVTLALPEVAVTVDADTVMVPVHLRNTYDDVGGLQLDLGYGGAGDTSMLAPGGVQVSRPKFVAVHTTGRTAGWTINVRPLPPAGSKRILLYDPGGEDIPAGTGPVMELLFAIPDEGVLLDSFPLIAETVIVSDVVGEALPSRAVNGSLSVGGIVRFRLHSTTADHGDTASVSISLFNRFPVAGAHVTLTWDSEWIRVVDITSTERTARLQLEWEADDNGAWIWLHAPAGYELEPGEGPILSVSCEIAPGIYSRSIDLRLENARIIDSSGRERYVTRIVPGRLTVYPGYLDPPQNLIAVSGQDHRVPLVWAPSGGTDRGLASLLLVDDDNSHLSPPYIDVGVRMADDLTSAGYAFDVFVVPTGADGPGSHTLQQVETVIWVTGYEWGYYPTLTPRDQATLAAFLERGGKVWLIGQDILHDISDSYLSRYFGTRLAVEDTGTPEGMTGVQGSILEGADYPASSPAAMPDYGDALAVSKPGARGLVEGRSHFGAVIQNSTAFWGLEYAFILDRMDRIEGIRRQLVSFGIDRVAEPGIRLVLTNTSTDSYRPRGSSPLKSEAIAQGFSPHPDSLHQRGVPVPDGARTPLALTGFALYRSHEAPVRPEAESLIAALAADSLSFVDSAVLNEQRYSYTVTAVYDQRFESNLSNMASAMPLGWIDFALAHPRVTAGSQVSLPIWMKNEGPVAGVRFRLKDAPAGLLSNPRVILGERAPPDWLVSAERDSLTRELSIIGFSPRLTTIPAGEGDVFRLVMDTDAQVPTEVNLKVLDLVISNPHGETYQTRVKDGSVSIDVLLAQLQVGTGAPTEPGDTGYVSIFMDNPRPVMAFQMEVRPALDILKVIDVQGGARLPTDAQVAYTLLKKGAVRLIESSFTHTPIPIGRGPVATLAYQVSPDATEGLVGLDLEEVALSDEHGRTLHQTTVSGLFPVGDIRGVFSPQATSGEPGRTVTIPVTLTSSVSLCSFQMEVSFDARHLTLLSSEILDRLPVHDGLMVQPLDHGHVAVRYVISDDGMVPPGSGPLFNLVFRLDPHSPVDTVLTLGLEQVAAAGCEEQLVFTMGQSGDITIGRLPPQPEHFTVPVRPTGYTHFIRIRSATLGGSYLESGDEVAVVDTAGWMGSAGNLGPLVVGCGVVQADGSVGITAVMGFERERGGTVLPGARAGGSIHFQAWDRDTDREGRLSSDARYVLGKGNWGENNGLTIAELVRIPRERAPASATLPERLELSAVIANPFDASNTIRFAVPEETAVKVTIYDLLGREVATLHDGLTAAGFHEVAWDGQDQAGTRVTNGMYFCQVRTPARTVTRKLLLMR